MRYFGWAILGCVALVILAIVSHACSWFGEAATTARQEFGPHSALAKYQWFKDAAAQLEKKRADIDIYKARVLSAKSRADNGDRTDRERLSVMEAELAGVMASYNSLAAEYNAASSKFNWRPFAGDYPPRTVVDYSTGD